MIALAFLMGLLGSLHCAGMCGPFAMMFGGGNQSDRKKAVWTGVQYNIGRLVSYTTLGVLFGLLGNLIVFSGLQQIITLVVGVFLVGIFLFSINLDHALSKTAFGRIIYGRVYRAFETILKKKEQYPTFLFGVVNGFLPCGMVYLALAGAIAEANLISSMLFMIFFGLGTFPMMFLFSSGIRFLSPKLRGMFIKTVPFVSLIFGLMLIYRGFCVEFPDQLNFNFLLNNPVMCH